MGLERDQLLNILKGLEKKQAIRFEYGNAVFIKFMSEDSEEKSKPVEKPVKIKKPSPRPEQKIKRKPIQSKALQLLQTENTQLQRKLSELKETVKELEQKASTPLLPSPSEKKKKIKKEPKVKRKFKPFSFMKNIKKLKKPEFVK